MNATSKLIYTKTSEKIEKIAAMFNFALVKMTPACETIPIFIASSVTYFTTDLGTDAFVLPFPTMW